MSSCAVVVALDVLKDLGPECLFCGQCLAVNQLLFQCGKETLRHRVVPTIASTTHALCSLEAFDLFHKGRAAILAALVSVNQHPLGLASHDHGRLQGIAHQFGVNALTELPAHHPATEQVNEDGQIQPTLRCPEIGDVTHPHPIGCAHGKFTPQVVGCHRMRMVGVRGAFELLRIPNPQPQALHAWAYRACTAGHARLFQCMGNAGRSRTGFVLFELALNRLVQKTRRWVSLAHHA